MIKRPTEALRAITQFGRGPIFRRLRIYTRSEDRWSFRILAVVVLCVGILFFPGMFLGAIESFVRYSLERTLRPIRMLEHNAPAASN
jgi:hypothetical protein